MNIPVHLFYEKGIKKYENLVHINDALNNLIRGLPHMPTLSVGIETLIVSTKPGCEDPGLTTRFKLLFVQTLTTG